MSVKSILLSLKLLSLCLNAKFVKYEFDKSAIGW